MRVGAIAGMFLYHRLRPFNTDDWHVKNAEVNPVLNGLTTFFASFGFTRSTHEAHEEGSMSPYIRPGFLTTHGANPIMSRLGRTPALIVRGRRSGRSLTVPMGEPLLVEGRRFLVSGRGETHWVRNLRAAHRGAFRLHGTTSPFRATEITGADRDRVVDAYRRKLGRSVDPYFQEIPDPAAHPVFRMDPLADEASREGSVARTA